MVGSADHQVQADYAANVLAVAKDEAITFVDANRRQDAGALLRERTQELKKMGDTYGNAAVLDAVAAAAPTAARVESEGLSNADRKIFRAESAQVKSQQATGSPANSGRP